MSKRSLKFKTVALSLGIIAALGITSSVIVSKMIATSEEVSIADFKSNAIALQSSIAAQFYERYGDVQAFAINPVLHSFDKAKMVQLLDNYTVMYGIYDLIMVVDAEGKLIATNEISFDKKPLVTTGLYSKNYKDEPWFNAVMKGQFTNDERNGFSGTYVEDPKLDSIASAAYGEQRYVSSFSAAIKDPSGKVVGVITNRAGARWFELEFQKLYQALKTKGIPDAEMTLINKEGVVLVNYAPSQNANNLAIDHDYSVLGRLNLVDVGLGVAKDLVAKKDGSGIFLHMKKKIEQVVGYTPILDSKFVSSLGWGVIVRANQDTVFAKIKLVQKLFYMCTSIILVLALVIAYRVSFSISKTLQIISSKLSDAGYEVSSAASQIASSAEELSQATIEQAASLQETSSSVEEINSMIGANTENAKQSSIVSGQSLSMAERGKVVVGDMINAISAINASNTGIMEQINDTNSEIENIVKIINEIGTKTKVINDIVFQTKLLSFNASVEAARAGEQGKGFSVVAEEVGNLAAMSGAAALEITQMLEESIKTVESIVQGSKEKIGKLILDGKEKVDAGTRVARECEEVLNEIVTSVASVSKMITEISTASQEQAQGVHEITKSVSQLDQVTQQNSANAGESANAASTLSNQAEMLNSLVQELVHTIEGEGKTAATKHHVAQKKNQIIKTGVPERSFD